MSARSTRRLHFLILVILLLALSLRAYRLDAQSFWNDEGNAARLAERTVPLILAGAGGDIHPPGYYLLLHYWQAAVGLSEFALRYLSVIAGVLTVALTYALGKRLFGPPVGLLAALLGAVSPLAVYYSQEARMYALLAALSAATTALLLRLLDDDRPPSLRAVALAYILLAAGGLYVHYSFPFVLLVHNALFALRWAARRRPPRPLWHWAALQVAVVALYLPWLPTAIRSTTGWSTAGRTSALLPALLNILRVLTVGLTLPPDAAQLPVLLAGLALLVALVRARCPAERFPRLAAALYLLLPVALIFALDLYKPTWLKFLVVVLPPFHLLAASDGGGRPRWPSLLLTAALALAAVPSLRHLYYDPAYARDDYRRLAADLLAQVRPGDDGIILDAPNQWEVFTYYYPDRDVYPAPYRSTPEKVAAFLDPLLARHRRLFVLYWGDAESDPQRLIESALASRAYQADDRWYGRVRLATYAVAPLPAAPDVESDARFGDHIHLRGYALVEESGGILPVTLFWETDAVLTERYKVTVQLLDAEGRLVAQRDTEPLDGLAPTNIWKPGTVLTDRYGLPLPPDLPPGRYRLIVGLYHIITGERLPVTRGGEAVGDHLPLTTVVRPGGPPATNSAYQE